jgi:dihydrofolate reductase / thymidylate synthase
MTTDLVLPYFSCIFCRDSKNGGFGYKSKLPWSIPEDMKFFKQTTLPKEKEDNILIMGKKTWESITVPLPKRKIIVVSHSTLHLPQGVYTAPSLSTALCLIKGWKTNGTIFVIGGVQLLKESFSSPWLERIYCSEVFFPSQPLYDTWFSEPIPSSFEQVKCDDVKTEMYHVTFSQWNKKRHTDENHYLSLLSSALSSGTTKIDRTKVGTWSIFGPQIEFDLSKGFPLITTKRVFFRGVVEELLWMLRGNTQNKILNDKGVHIWDGNASQDYLNSIGIYHFPEGELGKIYGHQWRHWNGFFTPQTGSVGGVDQIHSIVHQLKTNPDSRRLIVSAWNPSDLSEMALPCCHCFWQCFVDTNVSPPVLSMKVYLRSNDLFLGAPFNIASYALLVHMLAYLCHYQVGKLIYTVGDAHIYQNHFDQVKEQLLRPCRPFPQLSISPLFPRSFPEEFQWEDFILTDYYPHSKMEGKMAV